MLRLLAVVLCITLLTPDIRAPPANDNTSWRTKNPKTAPTEVSPLFTPSSFVSSFTATIVSVNSTMTSMSITTVTANITVVNGPRACSS